MWSYIQPQLSAEESCSDPHGVNAFAWEICDATFIHNCHSKSHKETHMEWRHLHVKYVILHSTTVVSWRVMERPTWSEGICMWNMWCNIHSQLSLEESWRDPHGVKAFACELCDLTFNQSCNLKSYDAAQQEEKPLAFEKCDAIFNHSCQLKIHEATHLEWRHLHVQYVMQHSFTVVIWRVMMQPDGLSAKSTIWTGTKS